MNSKIIITCLAGSLIIGVVVHRWTQPAAPILEPEPSQPVLIKPQAMKFKGMGPRLPAPRIPVAEISSEMPAETAGSTNLVARLLTSNLPSNLSLEQVESYLRKNQRNAESMLTAFRLTGNAELLREATEKYPNDPRVAFTAIHHSQSPEERRQWLDVFKQAAPDNALANYLSALGYLKSGQGDQAVQELIAAANQPNWQDYIKESIQSSEEAYLSAGYSVAEAKALSVSCLSLPSLGDMRDLGRRMVDLADLYRQAGDITSAQAVLDMGLTLGQRISPDSGGGSLMQDLVRLAIERQMLTAMDSSTPYGAAGQTVQNRLDELIQRRENIKELGKQSTEVLKTMSENDLVIYFDRLKMNGEESALRWALNRHTQP